MKIQSTITPDDYEEVSQKIHKILALAKDKGATADEKAKYTAIVQRLLFKHNLSIENLAPRADGSKKKAVYKKERVNVGVKHEQLRKWKVELMECIAENNFCKVMDAWGDNLTIIGEDENVLVVKQMYAYLEYEIRALCRDAFKAARAGGRTYSQTGKMAWTCSFKEGAVDMVSSRLVRQREEDVAEANMEVFNQRVALNGGAPIGSGTALVLVKKDELQEAIYEFYPYLRPRTQAEILAADEAYRKRRAEAEAAEAEERAKPGYKEPKYKEYKRRGRPPGWGESKHNRSAYSQGVQAGSTIRIHKEVGSGKAALNK